MSIVDSIISIVIFHILYVVMLVNIVVFLQIPVKFALQTIRHGTRERNNATEQIKIVLRSSAHRADALLTELRCQLVEPEF